MTILEPMTAPRRIPLPVRDALPVSRVLIVDDSLVMRSIVQRIVEAAPGFSVCASLPSAQAALDFLARDSADIILLDIEMPRRSGLDALPDLIAASHRARILVLSSHCREGAPATLKALALGASDTLSKPDQQLYPQSFITALHDKLHVLGDAARFSREAMPPVPARPVITHSTLDCIAIGSSTGGISAIHEFLGALDPGIDAPILVTQHLPADFMPFLVRHIADLGLRPVHLAEDGAVLQRGHIYCAPGNAHLGLRASGETIRVALIPEWPRTAYKPSVDPMFTAVARCFGASGAGVMLSGMGADGLAGAHLLADEGAPVYVQDAQSSTVWGMPGAIARAGLASVMLPPAGIARFIADCWLEPK
ncbi:chemotaxis protein CheB [Blastomonas sp.]|uniref:chemotaxis protein CheB n=1 Tax=Blastomonas sp. TaxID=1909299 RepID=UPI00261A2ACF|nr:chemotaxis protein CheB [Blastomonas sp.]MDM7957142.1 chemotaxis protein CheB [Blastomonas sp.]